MHLEIIDKNRIDLLNKLRTIKSVQKFALGGGTGLSLQLGLRQSIDFDFFTAEHFNVELLLDELRDVFKNQIEVVNQEGRRSTLDLFINKIKVSFFEYKYLNLKPLLSFNEFKPLKLLSIEDIMTMKAIAIIQRGTKKDFSDLYFIIKELKLNAPKLIKLLDQKFNDKNINMNFMLSIAFFEDADHDVLPHSYVKYSWEDIKKYFILFQKELKKNIR